jgi:hypothetical protein
VEGEREEKKRKKGKKKGKILTPASDVGQRVV